MKGLGNLVLCHIDSFLLIKHACHSISWVRPIENRVGSIIHVITSWRRLILVRICSHGCWLSVGLADWRKWWNKDVPLACTWIHLDVFLRVFTLIRLLKWADNSRWKPATIVYLHIIVLIADWRLALNVARCNRLVVCVLWVIPHRATNAFDVNGLTHVPCSIRLNWYSPRIESSVGIPDSLVHS